MRTNLENIKINEKSTGSIEDVKVLYAQNPTIHRKTLFVKDFQAPETHLNSTMVDVSIQNEEENRNIE